MDSERATIVSTEAPGETKPLTREFAGNLVPVDRERVEGIPGLQRAIKKVSRSS